MLKVINSLIYEFITLFFIYFLAVFESSIMESAYIKIEEAKIDIKYEKHEPELMETLIKTDIDIHFNKKELEEQEMFIKHEEIEIKTQYDDEER